MVWNISRAFVSSRLRFHHNDQKVETHPHVVPSDPTTSAADQLANLSEEQSKLLRVLKLEHSMLLYTGIRVPENVSDENWLKILHEYKTYNSRRRYFQYLFKTEKAKANEYKKKAEKKVIHEAKYEKIKELQKENELGFRNTYLMRVRESTMNRFYDNNLCNAMVNGPHLVFDLSFEKYMTDREMSSLLLQVVPYFWSVCH